MKTQPHNIDAEKHIISAIIKNAETLSRVLEHVSPVDFYHKPHEDIVSFACELFEEGKPVNIVSLSEKAIVNSKNNLVPLLAELSDYSLSTANLSYYLELVKGKAALRKMINKATEVIEICCSSIGDSEEIIDECEQKILDSSSKRKSGTFELAGKAIDESIKLLEKRAGNNDPVTGVPTGYDKMDYLLCGWQPGDLIILAGRPSMGKTALALNLCLNASVKYSIPSCIFSLEMNKEQLGNRMISKTAKVQGQRIRTGNLRKEDWPKIIFARDKINQATIAIDDTPALSILDVRARARRMKQDFGVGLILVDYLQLMRGTGKTNSREQEISEISRGLKALAKELNVPVIALSQLNRSLESRPNKRPILSDLRESGAIEQDADVIVFLYRDEVYNKAEDNPRRGIAEVIIGKQRNGPVGSCDLVFLDGYGSFEEMAI